MSSTLETIAIRTLRLSRNCTQYNHCYINREIYRERGLKKWRCLLISSTLISPTAQRRWLLSIYGEFAFIALRDCVALFLLYMYSVFFFSFKTFLVWSFRFYFSFSLIWIPVSWCWDLVLFKKSAWFWLFFIFCFIDIRNC